MNKIENLFEQSINKTIELVECMTDINQKALVYAQITQALATVINNKSGGDNVQQVACEKSEKVSVNENTNILLSSIADKWTPPLDENGIPYLPEEFNTDAQKIIAYNKAVRSPEIKELKKKIEEEAAKKILSEKEEKKEEPKEETKTNSIKKKELSKKANKEEVKEEVVVDPKDLEKLQMYKQSLDYDQDPTFLNELLSGFTTGVETSVDTMPDEMIKVLVSFLDNEFEEKSNKLEQYKTELGVEYLNGLLSEMYGEECNIDEHVGYINIIQFVEYIAKAYANYYLGLYTEEDGEYYIADLNSYIAEYLQDKDATLEYINDDNVVGFIDYLNNL